MGMSACSVMSNSLGFHGLCRHQAPLSMKVSRQEYWSVLPFPSLGNLPDPGIQLKSRASPALAGSLFATMPPGKPRLNGQVPLKSLLKLPL